MEGICGDASLTKLCWMSILNEDSSCFDVLCKINVEGVFFHWSVDARFLIEASVTVPCNGCHSHVGRSSSWAQCSCTSPPICLVIHSSACFIHSPRIPPGHLIQFCFPRISFPPRSIPGPCISDPFSLCWCFDNVQAMSLQHFSSLSAPLCHNKERKWGRCRMLTGPLKDLRWEKHRSQNTLNGALFMWAKNRKMITCLPDL